MLINIWATIVHVSDAYFATADSSRGPDLDLLVSERLAALTSDRQIWMINPVWRDPGTGNVLLRDSYAALRDSEEAYLVLYTPGFADIAAETATDVAQRHCHQITRRARAFNKRLIVTALGVPPDAPEPLSAAVGVHNRALADAVAPFDGRVADLSDLAYRPWSDKGSRPADLSEAARRIAEAVLESHAQPEAWRAMHPPSD